MKLIKYAFYDDDNKFIGILNDYFRNIPLEYFSKYDELTFNEDKYIKYLPSFIISIKK